MAAFHLHELSPNCDCDPFFVEASRLEGCSYEGENVLQHQHFSPLVQIEPDGWAHFGVYT